MARITIEDCLDEVPNRFALITLAAKWAKPLLATENREVVTELL